MTNRQLHLERLATLLFAMLMLRLGVGMKQQDSA